MGFSVTHSDGSVTRHDSYSDAMSAANASAASSGASVKDTTGRSSGGGGENFGGVKAGSGLGGSSTSGSASDKGIGGAQGDKSSSGKDWSPGPSTSTSKDGTSVSGQVPGDWGWDRNRDGTISNAEKFLDRIDGGGRGRTGPTFEGGLFSDAFNSIGISPYGQGSGFVSGGVDRLLGTAPPSSIVPVPRGTPTPAPTFGQRFSDFLRGNRPLVGMGGVFNYEGTTSDGDGGSGTNPFGVSSGDGGNDGPPITPEQPPVTTPEIPNDGRPPWWPPYLPWPPEPGSPYAPVTGTAPTQSTQTGGLPVTPYYSSYSDLQSAISGAQNPLMMGIGGIVRRP